MAGIPTSQRSATAAGATLVVSTRAGTDARILGLRPEVPIAVPAPAQFFMISPPAGRDPLLPRPFSIYRLKGGDLFFLVQVAGRATRALVELPVGSALHLVGPLGRPWPAPRPGEHLVLVAGGVGLAPFPLQIERALAAGLAPDVLHLLYGARSAAGLFDLAWLQALGIDLRIATEDGSAGTCGLVTDLLRAGLESGAFGAGATFLVCGPDPMMAAVRRLLEDRGLMAWFSLETYMACGLGVCNGCAVAVDPAAHGGWPYAKACLEGPVFSSLDLRAGALEDLHG